MIGERLINNSLVYRTNVKPYHTSIVNLLDSVAKEGFRIICPQEKARADSSRRALYVPVFSIFYCLGCLCVVCDVICIHIIVICHLYLYCVRVALYSLWRQGTVLYYSSIVSYVLLYCGFGSSVK